MHRSVEDTCADCAGDGIGQERHVRRTVDRTGQGDDTGDRRVLPAGEDQCPGQHGEEKRGARQRLPVPMQPYARRRHWGGRPRGRNNRERAECKGDIVSGLESAFGLGGKDEAAQILKKIRENIPDYFLPQLFIISLRTFIPFVTEMEELEGFS